MFYRRSITIEGRRLSLKTVRTFLNASKSIG
jgi:hypothetical protein